METVGKICLNSLLGALSPIGAFIRTPNPLAIVLSLLERHTYRDPVSLSNKDIEKYNQDTGDADWNKETLKKVENILENDEIRKIFSKPMTYDVAENTANIKILETEGLSPLSLKFSKKTLLPWYNVVLDKPSNLILKLSTRRIPNDSYLAGLDDPRFSKIAHAQPKESLLRFAMTRIMSTTNNPGDLNITFPKKMAIAIASKDPSQAQQYIIASERVNVLSADEMAKVIISASADEQKKLAIKLHTFVQKTGYIDANLGENLAFKKDDTRSLSEREIINLDTEPMGSLVEGGTPPKFSASSVEKSGQIGAYLLCLAAFKIAPKSPFIKKLLELEKNHRSNWDEKKLKLCLTIIYLVAIVAIAILKSIYIYALACHMVYRLGHLSCSQRVAEEQREENNEEAISPATQEKIKAQTYAAYLSQVRYYNAINEISDKTTLYFIKKGIQSIIAGGNYLYKKVV